MRVTWKSGAGISLLLAGAAFGHPALAADCGPLPVLTRLDLNPRAGVPIVPAMIDDKPVNLLVDTGGAFSVLTKRTIREFGLPTSTSRVELRNTNGQRENLAVRLPSITLGLIRQEGVFFMVDPREDDPRETRPQAFHGTLGPDFLTSIDLDFDFAANKLNIVSQNHCAGKVVYWHAPTLAVLPMTLDQSGHIIFRMQVDGRRVNGALDTGMTTTIMNLTTARQRFDVDVNAADVEKIGEVSGGGYNASAYRRRFKSIAFEGVTISNPMIDLLPDLMSGTSPGAPRTGSLVRPDRALPDVILGMSTLSQLHVYIAYNERKVYITPAGSGSAATPPAQ